jgi:hypothetical protein
MKQLNQRIAHLVLPERLRSLKISDEGFPVPVHSSPIEARESSAYHRGYEQNQNRPSHCQDQGHARHGGADRRSLGD